MRLEYTVGVTEPDFLDRAADSVVEQCPTEPLLSPDGDMLREALAEVVESVRNALAGRDPTPPEIAQIDPCRLLRLLRGAVLDDWSGGEESLLRILRAFERTERVLAATGEGVAANPFSRSLLREVVHLLLSPLGSVVMLAGRLRDEQVGPLNEEQHRLLSIIHRAAASTATTSSDLLTLTTPDEHFRGSRRFSVEDSVTIVAEVVRPLTEARGSELVVRTEVGGLRRGPSQGIAQALLGLAIRVALLTRDGTVELDARAGEGDLVSFSLAGRGSRPAARPEDPFLMFRSGPGSEGYTLSAEAVAFSAGRQTLRSMGSDLEIRTADDGALTLRFEMSLPMAD